jgi:transposase
MALFVGLDASLRTISVCIVESKGKVVWEGKVLCEGPALIAALAPYRKKIKSVGIEAGPLAEWLFGILTECHFNAVCIETRHAHRFLSSRPNKTDRNDARGIADMMRLGHFKAVHVKSRTSQLLRTMLAARKTFVDHMLEIEQAIRGFLKVYGLKLGQVHRYNFSAKVKAMVADTPELAAAIAPLLEARDMMRKKKKEIDRELEKRARQDAVCKRLMTIPGVGPIISLAYKATIDDPARFKSSRAVPAHLGLTPRIYQSGEMDRSGHISKCGDRLLRHCLYEAASAHMRVTKKWSALRAWGVKLAKRVGSKKACVAVARKLAIIMHRMWREDIDFQFGTAPQRPARA